MIHSVAGIHNAGALQNEIFGAVLTIRPDEPLAMQIGGYLKPSPVYAGSDQDICGGDI